jgi:cobalt-zinc-cadmium efflux system outer membrane protein
MLPRWFPCAVGLLLLAGCVYPVRQEADSTVCNIANHPIDPEPIQVPAALESAPAAQPEQLPAPKGAKDSGAQAPKAAQPVLSASFEEPAQDTAEQATPNTDTNATEPRRKGLLQRMTIPPGLPGAEATLPRFPRPDEPGAAAERRRIIERTFQPLPPLGPDPQPQPGPYGRPFTLSDLQRLALTNSPLLRQPAADVVAARGAAKQAGAYPNPNFGYEADTAGTGGTAGYQGLFFEQTIKTGGKLKIAEAAAIMDLRNAEIALRRAQSDVQAQVRAAYFAVLVAQENMKVTRALAEVTDQAFAIQLAQFRLGGIAAAYEPMQLRVYAYQARAAVVTARNSYLASWTALAAALGVPALPPTELAGKADMPIPNFDWDKILARTLNSHTDVLTARVSEQRARYNLLATQVTPVPDVNVHLAVQKDYTTPPFSIVTTLQMGVPVPVWDQNQGAIIQAQGQLLRAVEESHRVRDDLTGRLADAFQRYRSNLTTMEYYRNVILPDQVRYYRGVYNRYAQDPSVQFTDLIVAQQSLGTVVATYLTTLGSLWTAVADISGLIQTDDLYAVGGERCAGPGLGQLLALPCCHPCSPLPDSALKGADPYWPSTAPEQLQAGGRPVLKEEQTGGPKAPNVPSPEKEKENGSARPMGFEASLPEFTLPVPASRKQARAPEAAASEGPALLPPLDTPDLSPPRPAAGR